MRNKFSYIIGFVYIIFFILQSDFIYAENKFVFQKDTTKQETVSRNVNPGGIFVSPGIGIEIPFLKFADNSNMAFSVGGRIEYSTFKLYPFILEASYSYQKFPGGDEYKTKNLLNSLNTKVHNIGLGCDVILNKYLKQTFTIIFANLELKYLLIKRDISPENAILDIKNEDSVFGVSGGLGFTLYIFDIFGSYTYAKEYSHFSIKTRFRLPLIRF